MVQTMGVGVSRFSSCCIFHQCSGNKVQEAGRAVPALGDMPPRARPRRDEFPKDFANALDRCTQKGVPSPEQYWGKGEGESEGFPGCETDEEEIKLVVLCHPACLHPHLGVRIKRMFLTFPCPVQPLEYILPLNSVIQHMKCYASTASFP